jgi:hypothetical protein
MKKSNRLQAAIDEKIGQWDREAAISAAHAVRAGKTGFLVTYPTGLQMIRFAEPFEEYGMAYEVSPEVWNQIQFAFAKSI